MAMIKEYCLNVILIGLVVFVHVVIDKKIAYMRMPKFKEQQKHINVNCISHKKQRT